MRARLLAIAVLIPAVPASAGDVAIILNPGNATSDVSMNELAKVFKLDQQRWGSGEKVELVGRVLRIVNRPL